MIDIDTFVGQNWVITPVADQKWLLVLSGIALTDIKGNSEADWFSETLHLQFSSALAAPLSHAINRYSIDNPGNGGVTFQVEQWTIFAAASSFFNRNQSNNSGFAVDDWRIHPFANPVFDASSNQLLDNIFDGIQVDVAVRDTDAFLLRVSYSITLLGNIVFAGNVIL